MSQSFYKLLTKYVTNNKPKKNKTIEANPENIMTI